MIVNGGETTQATTESTADAGAASPGASSGDSGASGTPDGGAAIPTQPEYSPNFKFKVLDQEKEFDEWLRPYVKDQDTEKKFRDLLERSYGLDPVKQERSQYKEHTAQLTGMINEVNELIHSDDFDGLWQMANINPDKVLKWAIDEAVRRSDPDKAHAHAQALETRQTISQAQSRAQSAESMAEQFGVQIRNLELNQFLMQPEVASVAATLDSRVGQPGAFRNAVIERGIYHQLSNGQIISTDQAIREVMALIGSVGQPAPFNPNTGIPSPQAGMSQKKPVIPNIRGGGTSPAKKVIKSLDDLRRIASEKAANG